MSSVHTTIQFSVELHRFHNIDLFQRGYYQIRCYLKTANTKAPGLVLERPILTSIIRSLHKAHFSPATIRDSDTATPNIPAKAISNTLHIIYKKESVPLSCVFELKVRLPVDVMSIERAVYKAGLELCVELWFADTEQSSKVFSRLSCVSERHLKLHFIASRGLHYQIPVVFDYFHLCAVEMTIHGVLIDVSPCFTSIGQKRRSSTDNRHRSNKPPLSQTWQNILLNIREQQTGKKHIALKLHRQLCRLLLSSYESLQNHIIDFKEFLRSDKQIQHSPVNCAMKLETLTAIMQSCSTVEEMGAQMTVDIASLSLDIKALSGNFFEIVAHQPRLTEQLRKQTHSQRMKRYAEAFFTQEWSSVHLLAVYDPKYAIAARLNRCSPFSSPFYTPTPPPSSPHLTSKFATSPLPHHRSSCPGSRSSRKFSLDVVQASPTPPGISSLLSVSMSPEERSFSSGCLLRSALYSAGNGNVSRAVGDSYSTTGSGSDPGSSEGNQLANLVRSSDYLARLPALPVDCPGMDGEPASIPVIFEEIYRPDLEDDENDILDECGEAKPFSLDSGLSSCRSTLTHPSPSVNSPNPNPPMSIRNRQLNLLPNSATSIRSRSSASNSPAPTPTHTLKSHPIIRSGFTIPLNLPITSKGNSGLPTQKPSSIALVGYRKFVESVPVPIYTKSQSRNNEILNEIAKDIASVPIKTSIALGTLKRDPMPHPSAFLLANAASHDTDNADRMREATGGLMTSWGPGDGLLGERNRYLARSMPDLAQLGPVPVSMSAKTEWDEGRLSAKRRIKQKKKKTRRKYDGFNIYSSDHLSIGSNLNLAASREQLVPPSLLINQSNSPCPSPVLPTSQSENELAPPLTRFSQLQQRDSLASSSQIWLEEGSSTASVKEDDEGDMDDDLADSRSEKQSVVNGDNSERQKNQSSPVVNGDSCQTPTSSSSSGTMSETSSNPPRRLESSLQGHLCEEEGEGTEKLTIAHLLKEEQKKRASRKLAKLRSTEQNGVTSLALQNQESPRPSTHGSLYQLHHHSTSSPSLDNGTHSPLSSLPPLVHPCSQETLHFLYLKEQLRSSMAAHYQGSFYSDFPVEELAARFAYFSQDVPNSKLKDIHLVVCVHGLDGNSGDLRLVKAYLELALPEERLEFLMAEKNQGDTFGDLNSMRRNLMSEILHKISNMAAEPAKISFIGHSMGCLLIRAVLTSPEMQPYLSRLHAFLSLSGPHLGTVYNPSSLVNMGMWFLQKVKKSESLRQLCLRDASDVRQSYLYWLSDQTGLEHFVWVLLVSSQQDHYVPFHSTRIELCREAVKDSEDLGMIYMEMITNILQRIIRAGKTTVIRYDVQHALEPSTSTFIGRAAHIAVLDSDIFLEKFICVCAAKYFR